MAVYSPPIDVMVDDASDRSHYFPDSIVTRFSKEKKRHETSQADQEEGAGIGVNQQNGGRRSRVVMRNGENGGRTSVDVSCRGVGYVDA